MPEYLNLYIPSDICIFCGFVFFFSRELQTIPSFPLYCQMLLEEHIALHLMVQDTFFKACQNYQSLLREKKKWKNTTKLKLHFAAFI